MERFIKKEFGSIKMLKAFLFSLFALSFSSCSQTTFTADENSALATPVLFENTYKVSPSEVQFIQPNLAENKTTLTFQVKDSLGVLIEALLKSQVVLKEDGQVITDFNLSKNSVITTNSADIILAVDVTGSMEPTIEAAKARLVNFVRDSRARGYHTRMCLSTFGDYTVSKCNRFYNNDPKDPGTEIEINELISEITKLKALKGPLDPGGRDFDENPMRAVIDAAGAPWASNAQRFMILVTDAGFLYSPGNSGDVGLLAPLYPDVLSAITQSQMKIFAVTPSRSGYEKDFRSQKGIVEHSGGRWYRFSDLVSGQITLTTVLDNIISSIDTTFVLDYTLTSEGKHDPSKPLNQRNITIELLSSVLGNIAGLTINSNLPNGRVPDPRNFVISNRAIDPAKLSVYVDNELQIGTYVVLPNLKEVEFFKPQRPNSKIKIKYQYDSVKDSMGLTPIYISVGADKISLLKFKINGIPVEPQYYTLVPVELNLASIIINDNVFDESDPFGINATGTLDISIRTK